MSTTFPDHVMCNEISEISKFADNVLLIGNSLIRFASKPALERRAIVDCFLGAKIQDIKSWLVYYSNQNMSAV